MVDKLLFIEYPILLKKHKTKNGSGKTDI